MPRPWRTDDEIDADQLVIHARTESTNVEARLRRLEQIVQETVIAPREKRRKQLKQVRQALYEHLQKNEELEIVAFARQHNISTELVYEVVDEFEAKGWLRTG